MWRRSFPAVQWLADAKGDLLGSALASSFLTAGMAFYCDPSVGRFRYIWSWDLFHRTLPLPAIQRSPTAVARRAPLQVLQRENRLPDLAPERRLLAAKPFEDSVVKVGQTKLASTRIAPGLEDFDHLAHFSR